MDNFNLDLLSDCSIGFNDIMLSIGLYPLITRHRITTHNVAVIDNIFTSLIKADLFAGITIDDISDYFPSFVFYSLDDFNEHIQKTILPI